LAFPVTLSFASTLAIDWPTIFVVIFSSFKILLNVGYQPLQVFWDAEVAAGSPV